MNNENYHRIQNFCLKIFDFQICIKKGFVYFWITLVKQLNPN